MSFVRSFEIMNFIEAVDYAGVPSLLTRIQINNGTTSVTYTMSLFNGVGYDSNKVREVHILCTGITSKSLLGGQSTRGQPVSLNFTDPAEFNDTASESQASTFLVYAQQDDVADQGYGSQLLVIPINKDQGSISYDLIAGAGVDISMRSKIIGFSQVG
jgi:hypothetical protein